jgi:hypothetical protein
MRVAPAISLTKEQHDHLQALADGRRVQVRVAERREVTISSHPKTLIQPDTSLII